MQDLNAGLKELQLALQTLLKKYTNLKKENEVLKQANIETNKMLLEKENSMKSAEEKIATTNITEMFNEEEKRLLQVKIDRYLKDIEKCLSLLNAWSYGRANSC